MCRDNGTRNLKWKEPVGNANGVQNIETKILESETGGKMVNDLTKRLQA